MLTIDRLIIRQVLVPTIVGLLLLLLLFTGFTSVRLLRSVAIGNLPVADVVALILVHDMSALEVLLPTAFSASLVMAMCTWHQHGEAYALYASGVHPDRVSRPLWILAAVIAILVGALSMYGRPYAYQMRYDINARAENLTSANMEKQTFYQWDSDMVIQAQDVVQVEPNLRGVFAQTSRAGQVTVMRSQSAQIDPPNAEGIQQVEFIDGASYTIGDAQEPDIITRYERLVYLVKRTQRSVTEKRRARSLVDLSQSDGRKEHAELQWRICLPFIVFFVALMCIELSRVRLKQAPYTRYAAAIILYVLVFNLTTLTTFAVETGGIPRFPGVFSLLIVLLVIYLAMRRLPVLALSKPQ